MNKEQLTERRTSTQIKDVRGNWFDVKNLRLVDITIPVYELSPNEAQELNKQNIRLRWVNKMPHNKGEPLMRLYELCG